MDGRQREAAIKDSHAAHKAEFQGITVNPSRPYDERQRREKQRPPVFRADYQGTGKLSLLEASKQQYSKSARVRKEVDDELRLALETSSPRTKFLVERLLNTYTGEEARVRLRLLKNQMDAEAHLALAIILKNKGDYETAETEFLAAIKWGEDATDHPAHYHLGNLLYSVHKDYDAAEAEYREALKIKWGDAKAHFCLGVILHHIRREFVSAEYHYVASLEIDPKDTDAIRELECLFIEQDYAGYERKVRLAVIRKVKDPDAHCDFAMFLWKRDGNFASAEASFHKALECRPDHARAHTLLGELLFKAFWKHDEAESHFLDAIAAEKYHWRAYYGLGCLKFKFGLYEDAEARFLDTLRYHPQQEDAKTRYNLAMLLLVHRNAPVLALDELEIAAKIDAKDKDISTLRRKVAAYVGQKVHNAMLDLDAFVKEIEDLTLAEERRHNADGTWTDDAIKAAYDEHVGKVIEGDTMRERKEQLVYNSKLKQLPVDERKTLGWARWREVRLEEGREGNVPDSLKETMANICSDETADETRILTKAQARACLELLGFDTKGKSLRSRTRGKKIGDGLAFWDFAGLVRHLEDEARFPTYLFHWRADDVDDSDGDSSMDGAEEKVVDLENGEPLVAAGPMRQLNEQKNEDEIKAVAAKLIRNYKHKAVTKGRNWAQAQWTNPDTSLPKYPVVQPNVSRATSMASMGRPNSLASMGRSSIASMGRPNSLASMGMGTIGSGPAFAFGGAAIATGGAKPKKKGWIKRIMGKKEKPAPPLSVLTAMLRLDLTCSLKHFSEHYTLQTVEVVALLMEVPMENVAITGLQEGSVVVTIQVTMQGSANFKAKTFHQYANNGYLLDQLNVAYESQLQLPADDCGLESLTTKSVTAGDLAGLSGPLPNRETNLLSDGGDFVDETDSEYGGPLSARRPPGHYLVSCRPEQAAEAVRVCCNLNSHETVISGYVMDTITYHGLEIEVVVVLSQTAIHYYAYNFLDGFPIESHDIPLAQVTAVVRAKMVARQLVRMFTVCWPFDHEDYDRVVQLKYTTELGINKKVLFRHHHPSMKFLDEPSAVTPQIDPFFEAVTTIVENYDSEHTTFNSYKCRDDDYVYYGGGLGLSSLLHNRGHKGRTVERHLLALWHPLHTYRWIHSSMPHSCHC